jgi:hypothetical protein
MGKLRERLSDAARSGVYRASGDAEVREAAPAAVAVDLREPVFDAFARALGFPDWFGRNWDALEDCLTEKSGVLLIHHAPAGDQFGVLADVLRSTADYWREQGEPFFAVFVDPARQLPLPDLFREK